MNIIDVSRIPLKTGGVNFRDTRLVWESEDRIVVKNSKKSLMVSLLIGLFFILLTALSVSQIANSDYGTILFITVIIIMSVAFYFIVVNLENKLPVLDKKIGWCWRGSVKCKNPKESDLKEKYPLSDIVGVQVLKYRYEFMFYELNIILENNERVNLMCHTDGKNIKKNATNIGAFLDVPVSISNGLG